MNKRLIALAAAAAFSAAPMQASALLLEVGTGNASVDVSGYDDANYLRLAARSGESGLDLELAYTDLGQYDVTGASNTYLEASGLELNLFASVPLGKRIEVFGRAGIFAWNAEATLFGVKLGSDDGSDTTYGGGVNVDITKHIGVSLDVQRYNSVSGGDINRRGLALNMRF